MLVSCIHFGNKTPIKKTKKQTVRAEDSDMDSDNEILMKSETNWPKKFDSRVGE